MADREEHNPRPGYVPMVSPPKFDRIDAPKTVTYYEHATTLFDIIRMPNAGNFIIAYPDRI